MLIYVRTTFTKKMRHLCWIGAENITVPKTFQTDEPGRFDGVFQISFLLFLALAVGSNPAR